ncbi:Teneurin-3 [Bienertia sinuspersici]
MFEVLLQGISSVADACKNEHEDCSTEACCEGLICLETSPGVFGCEPEACEDHVGHACDPNDRDCCEPLVCGCDNTCTDCTLKLGDACDGTVCCEHRAQCLSGKCECAATCSVENDCCEGYACSSTNNCVCKKSEGESCDPNACFNECCDLDCVAVAPNTYECHTVV